MFRSDRESVKQEMEKLWLEHGGIDESLFEEEVVPSTPPRTGLWACYKKIFRPGVAPLEA